MIVSGKATKDPHVVELQIGIDPKQLFLQSSGDHRKGAVDLFFLQRDATGKRVAAEDQHLELNLEEKQYEYLSKVAMVLERHVTIAPQSTELRVVLRDAGSGMLGRSPCRRLPSISRALVNSAMLRTRLIPTALLVGSLMAASLPVPAQEQCLRNTTPTVSSAPAPLLPPEGYTDENGWSWPGAEWKQVSPESEGFSAERLDALRSFLKTHQTDGMMVDLARARRIRIWRHQAGQ